MRLASLITLSAVLLAGCAASGALSHPAQRTAVLQWGVVGLSDVPTLDPALASDPTSITVASLVYGGLVRLDSNLAVRADGAKRWVITHGGTVYTFSLRRNLRFPDGRRVTAGDFAAALDRALGPEGPSGTAPFYLDAIAHPGGRPAITAVDDRTLRITLSHPSAHFLAELAFPSSFVPDPRVLARYGAGWTDHAAGFGPYSVAVWRHGSYLMLQRNPHYYGGKPAFARLTLHFYQQRRSALRAYRAGRLDLISGLPPGEALPAAPVGSRSVPSLAMDYLAFNTRSRPFNRINARRAFAAVFQPRMVRQAMGPVAFPLTYVLPPALAPSAPAWRPSRSAAAYLAYARFPGGHGFPHLTLFMPRDRYLYALARRLQEVWERQLNVTVALRQLNPSNYGALLNARAFDLAIVRWGADYPDPQDFLGTQLGPSSNNVTGWSGHAFDTAIQLADSYDPSDPRRSQLFEHAARIAASKLPLLPLDQPSLVVIVRPGLVDIRPTALGTVAGDWVHAGFRP